MASKKKRHIPHMRKRRLKIGFFTVFEFRRCDHKMICLHCGQPYGRHDKYPFAKDLTILCSGNLVKL